MASILSLSAELKLSIIEQLDLKSPSFIPTPSPDLLSLSQVCKVFRTLTLPYLLEETTVLNTSKSGLSALSIFESAYAEHVRGVHYIGIMPMTPDFEASDEPVRQPSLEDLPPSVEQVLSTLAKLPNLKRVVMEFRGGKTAEDDEEAYRASYNIFEEPEDDERLLEAEKTEAFQSLMQRSYDALARNPKSAIKDLELRNVVAKQSSAWNSDSFRDVLRGLSSFTISLRGGDNGAGWQINMVQAYIGFVESLNTLFFEHLTNIKHLHFSASSDGPPGLECGMNNAGLPLDRNQMPDLQSLVLRHVFISKQLAAFITAHGDTLRSIQLDNCYSGIDDNNLAEDVALLWGDFFSSIASRDMKTLHAFDIGPSDFERERHLDEDDYKYDVTVQADKLCETFPGRRMLDYKQVDDKYGMLFDCEDLVSARFEDGSDHAGWEQLCEVIAKNVEGEP